MIDLVKESRQKSEKRLSTQNVVLPHFPTRYACGSGAHVAPLLLCFFCL